MFAILFVVLLFSFRLIFKALDLCYQIDIINKFKEVFEISLMLFL